MTHGKNFNGPLRKIVIFEVKFTSIIFWGMKGLKIVTPFLPGTRYKKCGFR